MDSSIITNSYAVGILGRNLVLSTLGKIYVHVQDKYYELDFNKILAKHGEHTGSSEGLPEIVIVNTAEEAFALPYPGDNMLIVSMDGRMFATINGEIVEWHPNLDGSQINNLTVNGVLTVINPDGSPLVLEGNPNFPPFIINSTVLVRNLNAEFLNGFRDDDFAKKAVDEIITGMWTFENDIWVFKKITDGRTTLDFENSTLDIDYINVRKGIKFPNDPANFKIFGTNDETWVSKELFVEEMTEIQGTINPDYYGIIEHAWNTGYLDTFPWTGVLAPYVTDPLDLWYTLFLNNGVPRDITDGTTFVAQMFILILVIGTPNRTSPNEYIEVFYAMWNSTDASKFKGSIYQVKLTQELDEFNYVTRNSVIKSENELYLVLDAFRDIIIIKAINSGTQNEGKFVEVGHLTNPSKKGNIHINSQFGLPSYVDITLNPFYNYDITNEDYGVNFPTLIKDSNNIRMRAGNLKGIPDDDTFGDMDLRTLESDGTAEWAYNDEQHMGVFIQGPVSESLEETEDLELIQEHIKVNKSGTYLKNPNISFNKVSAFSADGSGNVSNGRIRWTRDNLLFTDSAIKLYDEQERYDRPIFDINRFGLGGISPIEFEASSNKFYRINIEDEGVRLLNCEIVGGSSYSGNGPPFIVNPNGSGKIGTILSPFVIEWNEYGVISPIPAGGDLQDYYPNPTIKNGAVTHWKLADDAVWTNNVQDKAITVPKLADDVLALLTSVKFPLLSVELYAAPLTSVPARFDEGFAMCNMSINLVDGNTQLVSPQINDMYYNINAVNDVLSSIPISPCIQTGGIMPQVSTLSTYRHRVISTYKYPNNLIDDVRLQILFQIPNTAYGSGNPWPSAIMLRIYNNALFGSPKLTVGSTQINISMNTTYIFPTATTGYALSWVFVIPKSTFMSSNNANISLSIPWYV